MNFYKKVFYQNQFDFHSEFDGLSKENCDKKINDLLIFCEKELALNSKVNIVFFGLNRLFFDFLRKSVSLELKSLEIKLIYLILPSPPRLEDLINQLKKYSWGDLFIDFLHRCWPAQAPGLHFLDLSEFGYLCHVWFGDLNQAMAEFRCPPSIWIENHQIKYLDVNTNTNVNSVLKASKKIAVVGAGLAGSAIARRLCARQMDVDLFDQASGPAQGASGNWLGAFHVHVTRDDTLLSRLSRLGFEYTLTELKDLSALGLLNVGNDWDTPGHWLSVKPDQVERTKDTLNLLGLDSNWVHWAQAPVISGSKREGLFFPTGGWIKPYRWVQANLLACGERLSTFYNHPITCVDELSSQYDAVIIACAEQSLLLQAVQGARCNVVKGQITKVQTEVRLPHVVSGDAYAISSPEFDWTVIGATYERPVLNIEPSVEADVQNITRFQETFPAIALGDVLDHRAAVRAVWVDRLPAIGWTGHSNVYMATGYASRGLLWAALGARMLEWELFNETGPLFKSWARLSPLRYSDARRGTEDL